MTESFSTTDKIKVAIITGQHEFDVPAFYDMWHSITDALVYPQTLDNFAADTGKVRSRYDVVAFYNFHQSIPDAAKGGTEKAIDQALTGLGETSQGILVLHHALVAWTEWPFWSELVGGLPRNHGYAHDQQLHIQIANREHPITRGLSDWDLVDETYPLGDARPEEGNTILLTVDHPRSMKTLAWTRLHHHARVMVWQSGHDHVAFANPTYRTILSRSIQWLAGRL